MKYDAIIIGSGMSGLTATAVLCLLGKKVLLIEKSKHTGGLTRSYKRKDWEFNTGVHIHNWPVKDKENMINLWNILTNEEVPWKKCPEHSTFFKTPNYTYIHETGAEAYRESLFKLFPAEKNKIDQYLLDIYRISHEFVNYCITNCMKDWTVGKAANYVLGRSVIKNDKLILKDYFEQNKISIELQNHLAFFWDNYGLPPSQVSFTTHAIFASGFIEGFYIQENPSMHIGNAFLKTIHQYDTTIITDDGVKGLILNGRKIEGIITESEKNFYAENVISTIGLNETFHLFPKEFQPKGINQLKRNIYSFVIANFGFDESGNYRPPQGNYWLYKENNIEVPFWNNFNEQPPYVNYFSNGGNLNKAQCMLMVQYDHFKQWENTTVNKRGDDYKKLMQSVGEQIACFMNQFMPGFKEHIVYTDLSSPLTIKDYTSHEFGACYGIGAFPGRYNVDFIKPGTPIKGLYMGGQDVCSSGIIGAFIGGFLPIITMLKRNVVKEILRT